MRFQLVEKSTTLDDLERSLWTLIQNKYATMVLSLIVAHSISF